MKTRLFSLAIALALLISFIVVPSVVVQAGTTAPFPPSQATKAVVATATSSCDSGWGPTLSSTWLAEIRHGGRGGWRAILSNDAVPDPNDTQLFTGGTVPWPNGGAMHLSLVYSISTGYATMAVSGALPPYDPVVMSAQMPCANGKLRLVGKTSPEAVGIVSVNNIIFNGTQAGPCSSFTAQGSAGTRDIKYLIIDGVSGDFTLDCDVLFAWGSNPCDEGPALQINVENLPPSPPDTSTASTPTGSNVTVYPGTSVVIFSTVTSGGTTTVTTNASNTCGGLPENVKPEKVIAFVEVSTTAGYTGPITVGIPYDPAIVKNPRTLKLYHCTAGQWEDVATTVDMINNIVYGQVTNLSLFLLATGGCFIATAAYDSSLDSHVDTLRGFRDQYLETNPLGSAFVSLYYKISPPMAEFIEKHPTFKPLVRVALLPAVAMSSLALKTTLAEKITFSAIVVLISIALALFLRKRILRQRMRLI